MISSKRNNFTRYWFVTVDSNIKHLINQANVSKIIERTLLDKKGWKDYKFQKIYVKDGLRLRKTDSKNKYNIFHLRFSSNSTIRKTCNFLGLSCAYMNENIIYFNSDRWLKGAKKSGLALNDYRRYMIYHEIGHLLGRGHSTCSCDGCLRNIMIQATVANDNCIPNSYPLNGE